MPASSLKFQKLLNFVWTTCMRGNKNYSISEIKHLKPFKEIILNTETANYFLEYFGILVFFAAARMVKDWSQVIV